METSEYRREFAAYHSAREGALYDFHAGATRASRLGQVRERYSDLWSRDSISGLERVYEETPAQFETERSGLSNLLKAAQLAYADERARAVSEELSRCETASVVTWGGARLSLEAARARLTEESNDSRRRELGARLLDALRVCDDLRAARLANLRDAARELGFDHYAALSARARHTDYGSLLAAAGVLLARTAQIYASQLAAWPTRSLEPREVNFADEIYFARLTELDHFFPTEGARELFAATLAGLCVEVRANLRVEKSTDANLAACGARCFAVRPPADVRLLFRARAGADFYRNFFYEAGRAEQLVWTSADLAARHPEFVHAPDRSTQVGFGFLFRALFSDRAWLAESRGLRQSEAEEIARRCALAELHDARLTCALAREELELLSVDDPRAESLVENLAEGRREATGFRQTSATLLFDLFDDKQRASAGECLRGRLFAAALAEHLRARHGLRWWSSRAAGGELIDLWNTGSRYGAEELARLALSVEPDAELLAASLHEFANKS